MADYLGVFSHVAGITKKLPSMGDVFHGAIGASRVVSNTALSLPYGTYRKTRDAVRAVNTACALASALYKTLFLELPAIEHADNPVLNKIPGNMSVNIMSSGMRNGIYCRFFVPDAIDTIIVPLGHGCESGFMSPWIERMNKHRFNIVTVELPRPEQNERFADGTGIAEGYQDFINKTVLNPDSPIYNKIPPEHRNRLALVTHSASGQAFEIATGKNPEKAEFATKMFGNRIFHTGLLLDTANSSHKHYWLRSLVYNYYSTRLQVKACTLGTTPIDRVVREKIIKISDEAFKKMLAVRHRIPTHGQAHALKTAGLKHLWAVSDPAFDNIPFKKMQRTIIMGELEESACHLTIDDYKRVVEGINVKKMSKAGHTPLMECAHAYRYVLKQLHTSLKETSPKTHAASLPASFRAPQAA